MLKLVEKVFQNLIWGEHFLKKKINFKFRGFFSSKKAHENLFLLGVVSGKYDFRNFRKVNLKNIPELKNHFPEFRTT